MRAKLRPESLDEFIGQAKLKKRLKVFLDAAKGRKESLDHVLFYGPPGLGKTTLAMLLGKEMGVSVKVTSGPALARAGDLAAILTGLKKGSILFIDEIHRLNKVVEETLYSAMEDYVLDIVLGKGPSAKTVRLNLERFTIVGATTRMALVGGPMRDRFGYVQQLDFYQDEELEDVVKRTAELLQSKIDDKAAFEIAKRSRGTPRIANRLLKRIRDYAQVNSDGRIRLAETKEALEMLGIDEMGLSDADRKYLDVIKKQYDGGPVGVDNLAAALTEDVGTIEEVYEPYLMKKGLIKRTRKGRILV
ncbi:Holliday junction branch migration DNA helicase RuvB [Patescibacteria group bacterium]|nr:Holliday junction branch migration DNA helicase RuvB [Patescibacteria group bacterium]MCG2701961.1 Holliday junction branch migration DNA helicase RuvB [Candidatus Parcubacteria bacterium]MBU4265037.1 Holliday junction branch migration DNA helicase RuvB [Patescibacteria group bacterium]MBU4390190.1 Holliday junction branch migration DNA helicase RuvB [Patescibacteria group bacterium]MBU4397446.1 Holliday junction branch migration DNA helicase RuvB [Patescibacteria group bacterium]